MQENDIFVYKYGPDQYYCGIAFPKSMIILVSDFANDNGYWTHNKSHYNYTYFLWRDCI